MFKKVAYSFPSKDEYYLTIAEKKNLSNMISFLQIKEIDNSFTRPLSQREMSIEARVNEKYKKGHWIILWHKDKIIGLRYIRFFPQDGFAVFSSIVIAPKYRHQGLGSYLYENSINFVKSTHQAKKIILDTWNTSTNGIKLMKKFGFKKIGEYEDPKKRPKGVKSVVYELIL